MKEDRGTTRIRSGEKSFHSDDQSDPLAPPSLRDLLANRQPLRKVALRKLALWIPLLGAILLALLFGGQRALAWASSWLHAQPAYQLPFKNIELDPPPPPHIKSGSRGLIEQVRRNARRPELIPLLALDLEALAHDFQRESPWVRRVRNVVRPHRGRLVVQLDYRHPVARIDLSVGRQITLDAEAVVLPPDDLDLRDQPPLLPLVGVVPTNATAVPLPGRSLVIETPSSTNTNAPRTDDLTPDQLEQRLLQAVKLADFLARSQQDQPETDRIPLTALHASPAGLFLESSGTMILWTPPPGKEKPGAPTDTEKWQLLETFRKEKNLESIRYPFRGYLDFEPTRAFVRNY